MLRAMGSIAFYKGEFERALEHSLKSLSLLEKLEDIRGMAYALGDIGNVYSNKGEYEKAVEYYRKSLALLEKCGDVWGMAGAWYNLGNVYHDMEDYVKAMMAYQKSFEICKSVGGQYLMGCCLLAMAETHLERTELTEYEKKKLEEGRKIAVDAGLKELEAWARIIFGNLYLSEEDLKIALGFYESMGKKDTAYFQTLFYLGKLRKDKGLMEEALAFFEKIGNKVWIERVKRETGKMVETLKGMD